MSQPLLGCIADDFTGGTDLASMLVRGGMRTLQVIGIPDAPLDADVDAVVIALKTRTLPAQQAVEQSLAALAWLQAAGCRQYFFKYCSTFDSTAAGNIGPVADALLEALDIPFALACPAFPDNHRTLFKGHLFVGDVLLSESGMRHHPLTPMTDANLVRVLQQQTSHKVCLVEHDTVRQGADAVRQAFTALQGEHCRYAIVDAIDNADLAVIGEAASGELLVTGGSGVALGLPDNFRVAGLLPQSADAARLEHITGPAAVVSGSCSVATNEQVRHWCDGGRPSFALDPLRLAEGDDLVAAALDWARPLLAEGPVLVYASATPESVKAVQAQLGVEAAGEQVERALSEIASGLLELGVRTFVVAGGETSGAVVRSLKVQSLRIGESIAPGVPWTLGQGSTPVALALKSGNFGGPDFFIRALELAP